MRVIAGRPVLTIAWTLPWFGGAVAFAVLAASSDTGLAFGLLLAAGCLVMATMVPAVSSVIVARAWLWSVLAGRIDLSSVTGIEAGGSERRWAILLALRDGSERAAIRIIPTWDTEEALKRKSQQARDRLTAAIDTHDVPVEG